MCEYDFVISAGEHIRLWARLLFRSISLHITAHSAASALSSHQPPHALSTALILFSSSYPPFSPSKLLSCPKTPCLPLPTSIPPSPPPDIVIGNNGTSHHSKLEALSVALPSSLQFVSLSDNCRTFVLSQLTFIGRKRRCYHTTWIIRNNVWKEKTNPPWPLHHLRHQGKGWGIRTHWCLRHKAPASQTGELRLCVHFHLCQSDRRWDFCFSPPSLRVSLLCHSPLIRGCGPFSH